MTDHLSVDNLHTWVQVYQSLGLHVHPCPRSNGGKTPPSWWAKRIGTLKDFGRGDNLGARLGVEIEKGGFLCDVDIDIDPSNAAGWAIVERLLPSSAHVYGRRSKPRSHRLYLIDEPLSSERHNDGRGDCLIEFRSLSSKGKPTVQSVVPPGLHVDSNEPIEWRDWGATEWTRVSGAGLRNVVRGTAVALAILAVWPAKGRRHEARLAFSRALLDAGVEAADAERIIGAVVEATGGDESDVEPAVRDTARALDGGGAAIGAGWIAEHVDHGRETLKAIDRILDRQRSVPAGSFDVASVDLRDLTPKVWARVAALNAPPRLFLQGGVPVRVAEVRHKRRDRSAWVFQALDAARLKHEAAQAAEFFAGRGRKAVPAPPPEVLVRDMLATEPSRVPLPPVTRIVHAPTVAPDGAVQTAPGYQDATGAFFVDHGIEIPPVSEAPTRDEIDRAVRLLREPVADFPFAGAADEAHALALLLLPFVRDAVDGPTPLHLFEKPIAGVGATLLASTLLYPALGDDVAMLAPVDDDDEWRKQVTSTLLDGPSAVVIDNARELTSRVLAQVVTSLRWKSRILGVTRDADLRVECAWAATGINPILHQEIRRRTIPIQLYAPSDKPWAGRAFRIPNLPAWVREHRAGLVWAALTVARAWFAAGRPAPPHGRSLGMFEEWARVVGGMLAHAGIEGFLANLDDLHDADVETEAIQAFLDQWAREHGEDEVRIADLASWAFGPMGSLDSIVTSASDRGRSTAFALFVRRLRGRVATVGGTRRRVEAVRADQAKTARQTWRLAIVGPRPTADSSVDDARFATPF